jgi:hypothetical protein
MYRSRSRLAESDRRHALGQLFTQARANNKRQQISGALLLTDEWFVQTLEGDEQAVRRVFSIIEADPRHDSVSLLETGTVEERLFSRWSMARVSDDDEPDIPLLASDRRGVVAGASHKTTPAQDALLERMREAAHAGTGVR